MEKFEKCKGCSVKNIDECLVLYGSFKCSTILVREHKWKEINEIIKKVW